MKIRLYYNEDNRPMTGCDLYVKIASDYYEEICEDFLKHMESAKIVDALFLGKDFKGLNEDDFIEFKDKFIQKIIDNEYETIILYIDDCDMVD